MIKDGFTYYKHGLNCFVVPKYHATQAFRAENPDLFYLYYYLFSHYNLLGIGGSLISNFEQPFDGDQMEQLILNTKLGLELVKEECNPSELYQKIESCIEQGWPVFIPTNKRAYYYCDHYLEKDGAHLLLVTGYHKEKNLFVIHDAEQNVSLVSSVSSQFYMTYPMLLEAYESYNEHFQYMNHEIQYMRPGKNGTIIESETEALLDIAKMLEPYQDDIVQLLQPKIDFVAFSPVMKRHLMVYINGLPILTTTLLKLSHTMDVSAQFREEFQQIGEALHGYWARLATLVGVVLSQGISRDHDVEYLVNIIINYEKKYIQHIVELGRHQAALAGGVNA